MEKASTARLPWRNFVNGRTPGGNHAHDLVYPCPRGCARPQDIWDYIAAENVDAADRLIDTLFAAFERLAAIPGLGHTRKDLTDQPLRFWTVDAYLVIYRAEQTPIEIVAVTRGGRDIPRFLRRRQRGPEE